MSSLEEFWNSAKNSDALPSSSTPAPIALSASTQSGLATGIMAIATGGLSRVGEIIQQSQIKKFSDEVTKYVTSNKVISELSNGIGEPNPDETEDEFVERASTALREILRKKFNA